MFQIIKQIVLSDKEKLSKCQQYFKGEKKSKLAWLYWKIYQLTNVIIIVPSLSDPPAVRHFQ